VEHRGTAPRETIANALHCPIRLTNFSRLDGWRPSIEIASAARHLLNRVDVHLGMPGRYLHLRTNQETPSLASMRFKKAHARNYLRRALSMPSNNTSSDVKTASFFSYVGPGRISIARHPPRGLVAGYRVYRALAPGPWFNSVPYDRYLELYNTQLATLHPQQVWNDLHRLVSPYEPVLLCWERPPLSVTHWCHRTMVAQWFALELGHTVSELEPRPPR
jgi:hypothetical protein